MRWKLLSGIGLMALASRLAAAASVTGAPVLGVDVGAAIPTSKFQRSASVGGGIALSGGYRLGFGDSFAVSLLGEPQYVAFPTSCSAFTGAARQDCDSDSGTTGIFSFTAGPRFSLIDDHTEVFFAAKGGYYDATSGGVKGDGGGFNIGAGLAYEFWRGTNLGIFIRRDKANIDAARDSNNGLTFLTSGLTLQHRFLPPPAVAQAPPPAAPPPPAPPPVKKKIVLRGVQFDFDKSSIRPDARPILAEAASTLKENADIRVSVEGHTDNVGTAAYNDKLSLRRAEAVSAYLVAAGIEAARLQVRGYGFSRPVANNDSADGRAQNRRVELLVVE